MKMVRVTRSTADAFSEPLTEHSEYVLRDMS